MQNQKSLRNKAGYLFVLTTLFVMPLLGFAQLNGTYSINPKVAASATNYRNWASAVNDLMLGSRTDGGTVHGPGVNAKVTFIVYDTLYSNTQIQLTAINGATATHDITFRSLKNDSSKCVLQYPSGTSAANDYVLMLNGAKFITFQKMGFERTGSNANSTVIQIQGSASRNNILNCWIKGRKLASATSPGFIWGIGSCIYFSGTGDTTTIANNKMIYGYNGVYAAINCSGNTITGNVLDTIGSSGIYMTLQTNLKITANTFNMGDFGASAGHYVSYAVRVETSPSVVISKNKMFMKATNCQVVRAIVLVGISSSVAAPAVINNNFIVSSGGTSNSCGIALYGCYYLDIFYNNILITSSLGTGTCLYHNPTYSNSAVKMVNNNLINKGGGYVFDVYYTDLDTVNYNNCYTNGSYFGNWSNVLYSSYSAWNAASGKNVNSINVDPGYVSNANLHVSSIALNGKAIPYFRVTDDIDGQTRNATTPDIGADEFFPIAGDAGISNLDSPLVFCAGIKNVRISFQNYGYDTIYNLKLNWQINGVTQTINNWTGFLYPGTSNVSYKLGSYNFLPNTAYTIKIWSSLPNGKTDGNLLNDTIKVIRYAGMAGTYIISDTAQLANYKSFNNAITDMTVRGICGPINFTVYPGTYNEQITLWQLPGMGATNPITFRSSVSDSTKVILQLASANATGVNNAVVQLNGADFITFQGITLQRLTSGYTIAEVLHILNGANNNTFSNCQMIGTYVVTANPTGYNIWSDQGTDNNNVFRNNYVKLGTTCMTYLGTAATHEKGTVIEGNVFDSAYNNLVQIYYNDAIVIKNNTFLNCRAPIAGNSNLQLLGCDSAIKVVGNNFNDSISASALLLSTCNTSTTKPGIIANNFISKYAGFGIQLNGVNNENVVYNSFYIRGSSTSNAAIATTSTASTNILLKNNNIVMEAGYAYNINTATQVSASDRNNLYTKGGQFIIWGANTYTNLAGFKSGIKKDSNSMSVDPLYKSPTNLHFTNMALNGAALPISGVTTDIDGETRSTTKPDIGADEYIQLGNDAGIIDIVSPLQSSCDGQYAVMARLYNYGFNPLTTVDIQWKVNGVSKPTYHFINVLSSLHDTTIMLGLDTFIAGSNYKIVIRTNLPNGINDQNKSNDADSISNIKVYAHPVIKSVVYDTICKGNAATLSVHSNNTKIFYWWDQLTGGKMLSQDSVYITPKLPTSKTYYVEGATVGFPSKLMTSNSSSMSEMGNMFTIKAVSVDVHIDSFAISPAVAIGTYIPVVVWYRHGSYRGVESDASKWTLLGIDTVISTGIASLVSISVGNLRIPALDSFAFYVSSTDPNALLNHTDGATAISDKNIRIASGARLYYPFDVSYVSNKTWNGLVYYSTGSVCSTSRIPVYAVVNKSPNVNLGVDTSFCAGSKLTLNAPTGSGYTYIWKYNNLSSIISTKSSITVDSSGYYHVYVTDTCGFTDRDTILLTVNKLPQVDFTVADSMECFNTNKFVFTNTSKIASGTIISYQWIFSNGLIDNSKNPVHSFLTPNTYFVKLKAYSDKGCSDSSKAKRLQVFASPKADFVIADSAQCLKGNKFKFTDRSSIANGFISVKKWYMGNGAIKNDTNTSYSYLKDSSYAVKLVLLSADGCADSVSKQLLVYPDPLVSFAINSPSQCLKGNHFVFTNNSSIKSGSLLYRWLFGDGDSSLLINSNHDYPIAGSFAVQLHAVSLIGCSNELTMNVDVKPMPIVNLGKDTIILVSESLLLDAGTGFDSYQWSNSKISSSITVDTNGLGFGTKLFWVKVTKNGCEGSDSIYITFNKKVEGINQKSDDFNVHIYPNPTTNILNIDLMGQPNNRSLIISDMLGNELQSIQLTSNFNNNVLSMDISALNKGVYLLTITGKNSKQTFRVVKY